MNRGGQGNAPRTPPMFIPRTQQAVIRPFQRRDNTQAVRPCTTHTLADGAGVVPRGDAVEVLAHDVVEHPELDQGVAEDVGVGCPPALGLGDGV